MKHTAQRHRRRAVAWAAVAVASALALAGCSGPAEGTGSGPGGSGAGDPVRGGDLTVQISGDPGTLDMNYSPSVNAHYVSAEIFEKLFELDAHNKPRPQLVDSYDLSKDRLHYTFHLRKGIKFSDGTPMTSEDVVATLEYWMRVNTSTGQKVKADLVSMKAIDKHTVDLVLKHPRYPLLAELAGLGTAIIKKDIAEGLDALGFQNDQVIGTGPYKLKSWTPNQKIVLERNPLFKSLPDSDKESGFWGAKHAYLDTITFKEVSDNNAIVNGLVTGQWQYAASPQDTSYAELKNNPALKTAIQAGGHYDVLTLNYAYDGSIFSKQEARDALNLALDKKGIMKVTGGSDDLMVLSAALTTKELPITYSTAGDKEYKRHNPKKAKKLFEEAGYTDSDPIQIVTTNDFPQFYQWATLVQDQLSQIGVKSDIRSYDFTTMLAQMDDYPDKWDLAPIYFNGGNPVPTQISVLQGSDSPASATAPAIPDARPQKMKDLIQDFNDVTSDKQAHQVMVKLTKQVAEFKPVIALGMSLPYAAYTTKLKNYNDYWCVFYNSWLEK